MYGVKNRSSTIAAILMVCLMLFSTWGQLLSNETPLEEEPKPRFLTASTSLSQDTQTNSSQPSTNYGSAQNLLVGDDPLVTSARILATIPLTLNGGGSLPTTAVVSAATLDLTCRGFSTQMLEGNDTALYPARLLTPFNEANATHNLSDTGSPWNVSGVEGVHTDRGLWQPGYQDNITASRGVFSLNITSLVQESLRNGDSNLSIVISGIGSLVWCASSEHPTSGERPSISFEYTLGTAPLQGSIAVAGPTNGTIIADPTELVIAPDRSPKISWSNLTSGDLEIQFSASDDFRSLHNNDLTWNSLDDSSLFSTNEFQCSSNCDSTINGGMWVWFRMRSLNNSIAGPWEVGYFGLPAETGSLNFNSQAEIELRTGTLGLYKIIHDTWVLSGNSTYIGDDDLRMRVGHSNLTNESDMHSLIRVDMENVPIHDNVTIHEASLNIRRTGRTGAPMISAWVMESGTGHVFSELNYANRSNGSSWNSGGLGNLAENGLLGVVEGDQTGTSTFTFDATPFVQQYLRSGQNGSLDFIIRGMGDAGEEVEIASSDEPESYRPHLDLIYSWGDSTATPSPTNITPADGSAAWDLDGWELDGTTTPTLSWDPSISTQSNGNPGDVIIELWPSGQGASLPLSADSRTNNGFDLTNGEFVIPSGWNLDWAEEYYWRLLMVEDDEQSPWIGQTMLISQINSTDLGDDEYELRYRHGNGTHLNSNLEYPKCADLTLEGGPASGMNLDGQDLTASDSQVILFGCDLRSHQLPEGVAIVSATMRLRTMQNSGISTFDIPMTAYESSEHDWVESTATWNTTDGVTPWNSVGASGSERVQTLDTIDISSDNTWYEWNVTAAAQSAMRTDSRLDFILVSESWNAVTFYDRGSGSMPELVLIYTNGSNAAPDVPIDMSPANGDWILSGDYTFTVDKTPTLSWNETGSTVANAWEVQVDESPSFSSSALSTYSSWVDTSEFSDANFTFSNNLTGGETFYWRVRGISETGQVGLWSTSSEFVIPDLDVTSENIHNTTAYVVEMGHGDVLSDGSLPLFTDTWISWDSAHLNDSHESDDTLFISGTSSALVEIPISGLGALPMPSNARLVEASISFYVLSNNSSTPTVASFDALQDWNESATGLTYDGINNWSSIGAQGSTDRGDWTHIQFDQAASDWISFDFTRLAQNALANGNSSVDLLLSAELNSSDRIVLASTETQFEANEPVLSLAWMNGTRTTPSTPATLVYPVNNEIVWEYPAMTSDDVIEFDWSHPDITNIDGWIICAIANGVIWDGVECTNSEVSWSQTDLQNLTFEGGQADQDTTWSWFVAPMNGLMVGPSSVNEIFRIPNDISVPVNSTDNTVYLRNGNAHTASGAYDTTEGAYIDSCNANTAFGNSASYLSVGSSAAGPACTNAGHEARSLVRFDVSNVPIMDGGQWQVIDAQVWMYRLSGSSSYDTDISVSGVLCGWDEASVTWNSCATNNSWQVSGVNGVNDVQTPFATTNVSGNGWYTWNVTQLMQQAHIYGNDTLSLLFASEDSNLYARHSFIQEHAASNYAGFRPYVEITYRNGSQTMPVAPIWDSNLTANGPFTAWDENSLRPMPTDPLWSTWTHPSPGSIDSWQIQHSLNDRFTADTWIYESSNSSTWGNSTFDLANLTLWTPASVGQGDHWNNLRVRAVQDGIYSNWSQPFSSRVPEEQGSDDGAGNYSVTMQRGIVFEDSGLLPTMPDTWIGSNVIGQYQNHGTDTTLAVGVDPYSSAHEAVSLLSIDLTEYPYPSTMLPTSVTLRLYVASITGTGAHSISVHDCNSFSESAVTWNNFNPSTQCNSTAISSMTSSSTNAGVWYEWDVTSLARSSWAANGAINMALKTGWSGTIYFNSAEGSSDYAPELEVDYVDNPNNASSPAQVTLVSPEQFEVVYDVGQYVLGTETRPILTWNGLSDATGYVLTLSNGSGSQVFQDWNTGSGFIPCSTGITAFNCSWQPNFDLAVGEIYTWSVQALNGSVPGARSVPWTFGIGNPDIAPLGNHVHTVEIQEGSDVYDLGHVPIWDTFIDSSNPNSAYGSYEELQLGTSASGQSIAFFQIDLGQMPLDQLSVNPHSAELSFYSGGITEYSMANHLDLTAYAVLNNNYAESGATWNSASTSANWSTPGLLAGTDYSTSPLDTVRVPSTFTGGWLHFDVSGALSSMNGTITIVIIGSPNTGHMEIGVHSSEEETQIDRPVLDFNYTSVDSISLAGPSTTDADTGVQFSASLLDANGNNLPGSVIWSCSDGTIDSNGYFVPDQSGITTVSAAYGQVIESVNITVTAGNPVQLVVVPLSITLTADDIFDLTVLEVIDVNGNVVPGELITIDITNGTFLQGATWDGLVQAYSTSTPVNQVSWEPWTAGTQWMNISWVAPDGTISAVNIEITVETGAPNYFVITGSNTIEAGNNTMLDVDVYDQRGNLKDRSTSGVLTWGASDGVIDNSSGEYTGDNVGVWNIWVDSDLGIHAEHVMAVTYGDIADLEVTAVGPGNTIIVTSSPTLESITMTADESVNLSVVRIDVQGNREPVTLSITSWTWLNGNLVAGSPAIWDASNQGSSWVKATLEGVEVIVPMAINHGIAVSIEARTPVQTLVSGQDTATISAYASDADGNEWSVSAIWSMDQSSASAWLTDQGTTAIFDPVTVGDWQVNVRYEFNVPGVGTQAVLSDTTFTVLPGALSTITLASDTTITADEDYSLAPDARDTNSNDLPEDNLQWLQWDSTSEIAPQSCSALISGWTDISIAMRDSNYVWDATNVGEYTICAVGPSNIQSRTVITVEVGQVANIWHKAYTSGDESGSSIDMASTQVIAGETPMVEIWVADSDGNQYQTSQVTWASDSVSGFVVSDYIIDANPNANLEIGNYRFIGSNNQTYILSYSSGSCGTCTGNWEVTVDYASLFRLSSVGSAPGSVPGVTLNVEQQSIVSLEVEGFDQYGNSVPISLSDIYIQEDSNDLNRPEILNDTSAEVYMLNEGMNTITICDGPVCDEVEISVDSTMGGFFEAQAPWSWIGLAAVITLLLVVVLIVVILIRRGNIDDDEFDEESLFEEDEYDTPAPIEMDYTESQSEADYNTEEDPNYRVDEDGTEWWQDDDGTWWYRDPEMEDWEEWTE